MIQNIGKITLYVNNQEEAKKFWTEKLNFVVRLEQPMGPGMKWLEVGPANESFTTFVLYEKELMMKQNPDTNVGHPSVLLSTNDIQNTYQELVEKDVKVSEILTMPYGSMFHFFDMDDNMFLVREDK